MKGEEDPSVDHGNKERDKKSRDCQIKEVRNIIVSLIPWELLRSLT